MKRKRIVSGPVNGQLVEAEEDEGAGRARPRTDLLNGQVRGSKAPPRDTGYGGGAKSVKRLA